ncbi:PREDICTED: leucine-rich repeat-containing protein 4-like [Nicrophorus vespilloides]|uniref:Leucine-rich repeat-containing protein 4-like n=1 Tax=Nicrophorus vespilloides TaxID=110193 RepID=A0ABM1MN63_NICVS|nr:PREDICTED: leucine-rich repeat-containing protein 4-like [Nicrophorus vespilloides]
MFWSALFILAVGFTTVWSDEDTEKSPFCDVCECKEKYVDCTSTYDSSTHAVYESNYYMNDNNVSYGIETLILSDNSMNKIDYQFPKSKLKTLDLSFNEIRKIRGEAFANLQDMVELDLSHNNIASLTSETFKGVRLDGFDYPLRSLKTLRLGHNKITSLHSEVFQHIDRHIVNVYMNNNPMSVIDEGTEQAFNTLVFMEILDLSETGLKMLPKHFIYTPSHLSFLNVSFNNIGNVTDLDLEESHVLHTLDISGNPVVNITKETAFPQVSTLKVLYMNKMDKLVEIGENALSGLTGLEVLHLAHNPNLKTIHHKAFITIEKDSETPIVHKLSKLYINNNMLAHLDLELNWDGIVDMDIRNNPWTCECENQWLIDVLMPIYEKINATQALEVKCGAPIEMEDMYFHELTEKHSLMRCLDLYGNRPERDGTVLVCLLLGLLLGIAAALFVMYAYQRHWFGLCDKSPAAFSRQFYGRTRTNEDVDIY